MLLTMDKLGEGESQIQLDERESETIVIENLRIATPSVCVSLDEGHVELKPGERILIVGEEAHERYLFQAIAGLWRWGAGRIARPPHQRVIFMPTPGYAPPGTLRASLAYPYPPETFNDARIAEAFAAVGIEHLAPMLDKIDRWDRRLGDNDKQCLAVARTLLQKPRWVVLNRAFAAVGPALVRRLAAAYERHLPDVGVIYIGRLQDESRFFGRVLHLVEDPQGPCFKPSLKADVVERAEAAALEAQ
jgi:putative ATP-binding cassette transporter